jgi:hypothetical protein
MASIEAHVMSSGLGSWNEIGRSLGGRRERDVARKGGSPLAAGDSPVSAIHSSMSVGHGAGRPLSCQKPVSTLVACRAVVSRSRSARSGMSTQGTGLAVPWLRCCEPAGVLPEVSAGWSLDDGLRLRSFVRPVGGVVHEDLVAVVINRSSSDSAMTGLGNSGYQS